MDLRKASFSTKTVHGGQEPCPQTGALSTPIYQTSTFVFDNVEQGAKRFAGEEEGYIYSRLRNPTTKALEEKMALLENGDMGLSFGSGMAAITAALFYLLNSGAHVIAEKAMYGCTHAFLTELIHKYDVSVTLVDSSDPQEVTDAIQTNTKVMYLETPTNPTMKIVDLEMLASIAKEHNLTTIVDNTFMSPYFQKPLEEGIDFVVHSATKYIGGHGDVVGGILVGDEERMQEIAMTTMKDIGGIMAPMDAYLLLRGLKTLSVRMEKHQENALKVAKFLENHPDVVRIWYPGLISHPQHDLANRQMSGYGGMITFELRGGYEAGKNMMNNVNLCKLAVSLGDVDSLIQHPASMTHSVVPPEDRQKAEITDGLVRLSVGIEDYRDIINDLDQSIKASK